VALSIVVLLAASPARAADKDLCGGIDKDFISKHVMFPFERIVEKKPLTDYHMCMVIINVQGDNAPVYVPAAKTAVIAGEIFRDRKGLSQDAVASIEAKSFKEHEKELGDVVAFSYKPTTSPKGHIYMFTDPDCPYCERSKEMVKQFADQNDIEVRVVFFPLPMHPDARSKAVKGICGKMTYEAYLSSQYKGETCKEGEERIARGMDVSRMIGINGTPTFIVSNGRKVAGFIPDQLKGIMQ
jgi:thiol:disulfide interchange protein DsbC